jgi:hypothetical protein
MNRRPGSLFGHSTAWLPACVQNPRLSFKLTDKLVEFSRYPSGMIAKA